MNRMPHGILLGSAALLFFSLAAGRASARQASPRQAKPEASLTVAQATKQWEAMGLYFTRSLDAIEKAYRSQHGKFETRTELYRSGSMNGPMRGMVRKFGIGAMEGWRWDFSLGFSPDGKQYQVATRSTRMPFTSAGTKALACLPVFFSDQTGAIYQGRAIGCH